MGDAFQHHGELAVALAREQTPHEKEQRQPLQIEDPELHRYVAAPADKECVAEDVVIAKWLVPRLVTPAPEPHAAPRLAQPVLEHGPAGAEDAPAAPPRPHAPLAIDLVDEKALFQHADIVKRRHRNEA